MFRCKQRKRVLLYLAYAVVYLTSFVFFEISELDENYFLIWIAVGLFFPIIFRFVFPPDLPEEKEDAKGDSVHLAAIAVFTLLTFATSPAHAGMAVSDNLTHVYLSHLLDTETQTKTQAIQNVQEALKRNETLMRQWEAMRGHYDRAKGIADDIQEVKSFLDDTYTSILGRFDELSDLYKGLSDPDQAIDCIKALLDNTFIDPRTVTPAEFRKLLDKQFDLRQLGWKNIAEKADELLKSMDKRMVNVEELGGKVDKTVNLKDAQDLANRLLAEILLVLQEQLAMTTQYQQAMVTDKYRGVTKESIAARQAKLKELEAKWGETHWERQELERLGLSTDMSRKEIFEAVRKMDVKNIKIMDFGLE